jgi:glucose-1-phosphate thymidylyltransferase
MFEEGETQVKGIILAGGTGSRLFPLTKVTNKHLLPVGRYPMIYHPVAKLVDAGIRDILVVTGTDHMGAVVGTLGSGRPIGVEFTYRVQDGPGGIAEALGLARSFVGNDCCTVILGDNIFSDSIREPVAQFAADPQGAMVFLKDVPDPQRYGVAELRDARIVGIEEKPAHPKSAYCVAGIYLYDAGVMEIIQGLRPSARGELEITDVNNAYLRAGKLRHAVLSGWWTDAGTPASLALANRLACDVRLPLFETSDHHKTPQ